MEHIICKQTTKIMNIYSLRHSTLSVFDGAVVNLSSATCENMRIRTPSVLLASESRPCSLPEETRHHTSSSFPSFPIIRPLSSLAPFCCRSSSHLPFTFRRVRFPSSLVNATQSLARTRQLAQCQGERVKHFHASLEQQ